MNKYFLKNQLLAFPADWYIEPATFNAVKESLPGIVSFGESQGQADPAARLAVISEPLPECFTVPVFSEKFCSILKDELQHMKRAKLFEPNSDEDALRQIPEVVLADKVPELHISMMKIVETIFNPLFMNLWQRVTTSGIVQIANYNPKDKRQGAWHHDHSADITVVVPLNTGDYEGGGTEFANRGQLDPLPNGTALIFPAATHLHRGLPVLNGDRFLLVFWLKFEDDHES